MNANIMLYSSSSMNLLKYNVFQPSTYCHLPAKHDVTNLRNTALE